MSSSAETSDGEHEVELIVHDPSASGDDGGAAVADDIAPLLMQPEKPKINIFTLSYPRGTSKDQVRKPLEMETSSVAQFISWVWSGSRYSGLLCTAISCTIYFVMEVFADVFSVQSIPLLEAAFTRCTIILVLSFVWLRKCGQPVSGLATVKNLLISRALTGYISLMCFIYCIQRLPLSQAIVLSFTTPIMASVVARIILHEKYKIADVGGLACSFFGVLFIYRQMLTTQDKNGGKNTSVRGSSYIFAVLAGLLSSITGGISYCLTKAGSKASDQPLLTVFSFGLLASPAAGFCLFAVEEYVFPNLYSFSVMLVLSVLAFFAEVFLARGLQLEKTGKVANVIYMEAALSQLWGIGSSRIALSFGRIIGCVLILVSVSCTMYIGPDKDTE
ncbi:uncharacterized protein LOC103954974 [Pyrus x bretschneideri]|uniref:uncharacterized protein LOC103954974 n=1 Tax=Pyrus x bretschneideri TaxID=225117 RepID=UPI00051123A0|nr:uncharacterized protein LOC103954974 [Pyrus x bretschneideri]XP_048434141.1 uncharacterized protein LOC103954974 [Pyrus x bretschneideri]